MKSVSGADSIDIAGSIADIASPRIHLKVIGIKHLVKVNKHVKGFCSPTYVAPAQPAPSHPPPLPNQKDVISVNRPSIQDVNLPISKARSKESPIFFHSVALYLWGIV